MSIQSLLLCTLSIFIAIFGIATVSAYPYSVEHRCANETCIQGQPIEWKITVTNDGTKNLRFNRVYLVNKINNSNFTVYRAGEAIPETKEAYPLFEVKTSKKGTLAINDTVEAPNTEDSLTFYLCFTRLINNDEHYYIWQDIEEIAYCEKENLSITVIECGETSHCKDNEVCQNNQCLPISCKTCEYTLNHQCKIYACCDNLACDISEQCIDHTCKSLACNATQIYFNHTCLEAECPPGKVSIDHQCTDLGCQANETIVNQACQSLNCSFNQHAVNHTCQPLSCTEQEGFLNHRCVPLQCSHNETINNHQCETLHCSIFEEAFNHQCIFKREYLIRFTAETTFLLLIIALFILDVRKVKKQRAKGETLPTPSRFSFKIPFRKK